MADLSMYFDEQFDDRSIEASTGTPEPVPAGEYTMQVDKTEASPTSDQTGVKLVVAFSIVSGEYEGRKVFANFNVRNKNHQAQTIGISELKALALACGVDWEVARHDTDELLYKPFSAVVGFEKEKINPNTGLPYPPRNRVMKYIAATAAAPAAPARPATPVARPAAAAPKAGMPWKTAR